MALRAFIAASLFAVAGLCRAQGVAYTAGEPSTFDSSQTIYRVDLATRSTNQVGPAGLYNGSPLSLSGLTFGTDQKLYAVASPLNSTQPLLATVNTVSGAALVVNPITASTGLPTASSLALAFGCDGSLWMTSSEANNLWKVTASTGQAQLIGSLGAKLTSLAAKGSTLYGFGGSGNANLYTIDTSSGKANLLGPYGVAVPNPVDGAFDASGNLWGLMRNYNDSGNSGLPQQLNTLVQINSASGAMTTSGTIADPLPNAQTKSRMRGFAIAAPVCAAVDPPAATLGAPASSPAGLGVLLASMIGAALLAFRRRSASGTF